MECEILEGVRQFIDAKKLMSVIPLPKTMQNGRLEIIVLPAEDEKSEGRLAKEKSLSVDNIVDSLVGSIPDSGMTLGDYRAERLAELFARRSMM